ncbi:Hypothetical predicted protein [Cloeon dipterum]|uniref:TNFR-Cys domain-containing protein n=1 Tax=Cloeon dipterum TaxID=197152 RepID=A0A8S1C6Z7_9INSE|nr:Hypothetical predicted protein [Cloeon dipterum]
MVVLNTLLMMVIATPAFGILYDCLTTNDFIFWGSRCSKVASMSTFHKKVSCDCSTEFCLGISSSHMIECSQNSETFNQQFEGPDDPGRIECDTSGNSCFLCKIPRKNFIRCSSKFEHRAQCICRHDRRSRDLECLPDGKLVSYGSSENSPCRPGYIHKFYSIWRNKTSTLDGRTLSKPSLTTKEMTTTKTTTISSATKPSSEAPELNNRTITISLQDVEVFNETALVTERIEQMDDFGGLTTVSWVLIGTILILSIIIGAMAFGLIKFRKRQGASATVVVNRHMTMEPIYDDVGNVIHNNENIYSVPYECFHAGNAAIKDCKEESEYLEVL